MKAVIILVLVGIVLGAPQIKVRPYREPHAHIFAEVRPAGQKPQQQGVDLEVKEQNLVVETKPAHQASAESHVVEAGFKPAAESHVVEVEIKQAEQKPQHVELDIKPVHESASHVVELEIQQADAHQKPQHIEVELVAGHKGVQSHHEVEVEVSPEQQPPHQIEVEIVKGVASEVKPPLPLHSGQQLSLNIGQ
ncbi:uncharacterized protein LOC117187841 [Drosophila miranda]|uniref:uncharacterized protein LOC117187841 n=1 Tax=Drosophila miranda TaxID=7229 RepID=UPI0007E73EB6|nr:uncharacterized protein LOC117187841 [Drosophila miranda]